MRRKYLTIGAFVFVVAGAWLIYYWLFNFEHFTISDKTLRYQNTTYTFVSLADQTTTHLKFHAIGKTQYGDLVFEIVNDPNPNDLVVIQNTEMPAWELFRKIPAKTDSLK